MFFDLTSTMILTIFKKEGEGLKKSDLLIWVLLISGSFFFLYSVLKNQKITAHSLTLFIEDKFEPSRDDSIRTTTGQIDIKLSETGSLPTQSRVCYIPIKITFNGYLSKWKETFNTFNFDKDPDQPEAVPLESEDSITVSLGKELRSKLYRMENGSSTELKTFTLAQILGEYKPIVREIKDANQALVAAVIFQNDDGIAIPFAFEQTNYDMTQATLVRFEAVGIQKSDELSESDASIRKKLSKPCDQIAKNAVVQLKE
jgi:hypothetical protein